jgi:Family of unknown function (DUF5681)
MKDYEIGYGKTDPKTRWKKGQCGNPHRRRPIKIPSIAEMIDREFFRKVPVKERGVARKLTVYEVILLRLFPGVAQGSKRAIRIRKKYQAYAQAHPTVVYVPAASPEESAAEFEKLFLGVQYGPMTKEDAEYHQAWSELTPKEAAEVYEETLKECNEQWERDNGE